MGYAEVPLNGPDEFTKMNSRICPPRPVTDRHRCKPKPPIPTPIACRKSPDNVNFRVKNIRSAVTANPSRPLPRYVDSRNGDFHDLKMSGLVPKYIHQPQFGKIPKYLAKRIYDTNMQEEMHRKEQIRQQPLCRFITQPERTALLEVNLFTILFLLRRCLKFNSIGIKIELARSADHLSRSVPYNRYNAEEAKEECAGEQSQTAGKGHFADGEPSLHLRIR